MVEVVRKTLETQITCKLAIGSDQGSSVDTGIGFLDHMLTLLAYHGGLSLFVEVKGDLEVDDHHTVEDVGLVLGQCLRKFIDGQKDMDRYGSVYLPMDEALSRVVMDLVKRPVLVFKGDFKRERLGQLATENIHEFFKSLVNACQMTLHLEILYGENDHHKAESLFKGFGACLRNILKISSQAIVSTKGSL